MMGTNLPGFLLSDGFFVLVSFGLAVSIVIAFFTALHVSSKIRRKRAVESLRQDHRVLDAKTAIAKHEASHGTLVFDEGFGWWYLDFKPLDQAFDQIPNHTLQAILSEHGHFVEVKTAQDRLDLQQFEKTAAKTYAYVES